MEIKNSRFTKLLLSLFLVIYVVSFSGIAEAKSKLPKLVGKGSANPLGIFVAMTLLVIGGPALELTAVAFGEAACSNGTDNMFFTGCNKQAGSATQQGGTGAPGSPVMTDENYTATCNSINLSFSISGANQYGIYRGSDLNSATLINQGSAAGLSQITYTDGNLVPQTNYSYILQATNNSGTPFQYPVINAYTKCLPICSLTVDKSQIVVPAQATLSWNCQYANSCSILPTIGSVSGTSGTVTVSPTSTTNYVLTCNNVDGSISSPVPVNVANPIIKEINP